MIRPFLSTLFILQVFCSTLLHAQTTDYTSGLHLSARGGLDFPSYSGFSPYIDYKRGLTAGISADYYWDWLGIGVDFDYLSNRPRSTYPTRNLYLYQTEPFVDFYLKEQRIDRLFLGGGFSLKYQPADDFSAELKIRGGISSITGGYTSLVGEPLIANPGLLNLHGGFDQYEEETIPAGKLQLEFKYFFSEVFGINFGGYYMHQFNAPEAYDVVNDLYAGYYPFFTKGGINSIETPYFNPEYYPCYCDYSSWGITAGITLRFPEQSGKPKVVQSGDIRVTARDVQTGQLLPYTRVELKNTAGVVIARRETDANGDAYFLRMPFDDYLIEGTLYDKKLRGNSVRRVEFSNSSVVKKEILYDDPNFILQGEVVKCNTNIIMPRVSVVLKNPAAASEKRTTTDQQGRYTFYLSERGDYEIYAGKNMHLSQIEYLSTRGYNRNSTLFIKLQICLDTLGCGEIYHVFHDNDKDELKEEGERELNKVAQYLLDNLTLKAEIQGHTSINGPESRNLKLSKDRAETAKRYLIRRGISESRLSTIGHGEKYPLDKCTSSCSNKDRDDPEHFHHKKNRRTDIKIICSN